MRDEKRIDRIIEKLRKLWKSKPDLRLTQLIISIVTNEADYDPFYVEDNITEKGIDLSLSTIKQGHTISDAIRVIQEYQKITSDITASLNPVKHWETITSNDHVTEVDLTPIDNFMKNLEDRLAHPLHKKLDPSTEVSELRAMSQEQLLRLSLQLISKTEEYDRLYRFSFTRKHAEFVERMRELKAAFGDVAGKEFWSEID